MLPEPVVAVDDGERQRLGHRAGEPFADRLDVGEIPRLVDLPQLRKAAYLPLEIAALAHEVGDARRAHVDGVDLDEGVDEVEPEPPPGALGLEAGRQLVCHHMAFEEVHDVERDADHALVLADGADYGQPDAVRSERELEPRLSHHVVGGGRQRRPRRPAQDESLLVPLQEKREVRAATLADAAGAHRPRAEPVLVEEALDVLEDEERRLGAQRTSSAIVRTVSGSRLWTISVVTPHSRHASSRSAICSREPTSATSSTSASGTAAAASSFLPSR